MKTLTKEQHLQKALDFERRANKTVPKKDGSNDKGDDLMRQSAYHQEQANLL